MSARLNRGLLAYYIFGEEHAVTTLPIPFDEDGAGATLADYVREVSAPRQVVTNAINAVIRAHGAWHAASVIEKREIPLDDWLCALAVLTGHDHMLFVAKSPDDGPYIMLAHKKNEDTDETFEANLPKMIEGLSRVYAERYGDREAA